MERNLQSKITDIIEKSTIKDSELKKILTSTFFALSIYEDIVLQRVEKRVNNFFAAVQNDWSVVWNITTVLVKKNDIAKMAERGFQEIHVGNSLFGIADSMEYDAAFYQQECQFFLNCTYDKLSEICSRTYTGTICCDNDTREFTYSLVPHYRFIEQENLLFFLADMYHITKPVIYSPYARHAVDIRLENVDVQDLWQHHWPVNFRLEENGLKNVLLTEYCLMWNIEVEDSETGLPPLHQSQDTGGYEYFYEDTHAAAFIYPLAPCDEIRKGQDKIEIFCHEELEDIQYKKVSIHDVKGEEICFENKFRNERFDTAIPLRTRADITQVLSRFQHKNFSCEFCCVVKRNRENRKVILRYKRGHRYFANQNELYLTDLRYKPCCIVMFEGEGIFLTDYANYVLHFMEQHYPEFTWIGVTEREEV